MKKTGRIEIEIPLPDEAEISDLQVLADLIEKTALSNIPGAPSPAGIFPVPYGHVSKVELS